MNVMNMHEIPEISVLAVATLSVLAALSLSLLSATAWFAVAQFQYRESGMKVPHG